MKIKHLLYSLGAASTAYFGTQKVTHLLNPDPNHKKDHQTYPIDFVHIREEVEQVVSSEENNIVKIDQLKRIEKEQYKPLIHQLAHKETLEELKDLVIVLKDLGYLATKLGELSREMKYYTEAAVFYQYVITILKEKLNEQLISTEDKSEFIKQEKLDTPQQLTDIQQLIFSAIGGDQEKMPVVQEEAMSNKALLLALRNKTDQEMQTVEGYYQKAKTDNQEDKQKYQQLYVKTARELFEKTADKMKDFLAKLYKKAEAELGKAPCEYAVVGLGSMALKQMTPYSDLEFAILTENEDYKQSDDPKIKEYFKNLSHLVNFKMINLGESIIPTSQYGLDMSYLVHVAVNFDLGGKTPLGRIGGDKPYELIKTVDWMLHYVRNDRDKASHIDKNLPYILENVCYVYGDKELVKTYKGEVTKFLHSKNANDPHSRLNCEIRALKLLEEGAVEIDYLQQVSDLKPKETSFKGDLDKLKPNLSSYEGRLFDVKQEIYRLPDRMVYNLGLYYGIEGDSSWDTVDKLEGKGIINSQAALNLKNTITFATTLRLNTYFHHEAQKEDMSIFVRPAETKSERTEQAKQIFHLAEADLGEQGGLFQYFYTALPLHERLKEFCDQHKTLDDTSRQIFFKDTKFYKDDYASKGFIHYRLAQYKEAQNNLERALDDPHNKDNWQIKITLGNIYDTFGNSYQAIKQFQESLDILKFIYGEEPNTNIAASLLDLGRAYDTKGQYDQAIKCYEESLKMNKLIYQNEPNLNVAGALNNLGAAYDAKGQYDQAIKYYEESLKMRKLIYQDKPHPDVADSLLGLGGGYKAKGQYDQAIKYYEENLQMNKLIHKAQPHPAVAGSLNNLGRVYNAKGQYDQAINYYKESLTMRKLIYQDQSHPTVAASLNSLGVAYDAKGQYDQAIKYYEESLTMRKLIYQDKPHPDVAASLNNLGEVYRAQGNYDKAINYYKDSLKMNKLIHKDQLHPDIAVSLNNLGVAYDAKGQYDQAIKYYEESLKMNKLIHKDQSHPAVAISLNNLGTVYDNKGQYDQAIKYYEESLKMNKLIHKDQPHPDVAGALNNLGAAYDAKGQYDQAMKCYEESLEMKKLIHKDQPHPAVATSLNNLGGVYRAKGQYDQAIKYYEESLEMRKLIHKDEPHPDVTASLNNLGGMYLAKEQYDQAINYYEKSLKMRKLIYQDQPHPDIAKSLNNLGLAYAAKGEYKIALDYSNQALKIISVFPKHPYQNTIQNFMAEVEELINSSTTNQANASDTGTNDNIDVDVSLLGGDSSAKNSPSYCQLL